MLLLFLSIILIFIKSDFSIIHISDSHLTQRLTKNNEIIQKTISKINEIQKNDNNLKFVLHTGDITDLGTNDDYTHARSILNSLNLPYFVAIGNHDLWETIEDEPKGDERFQRTFSDLFVGTTNQITFRNYTGTKAVLHYQQGFAEDKLIESKFQNYVVEFDGCIFIVLDWISRTRIISNDPLRPHPAEIYAELHDFEGGSLEFFEQILLDLSKRNDIKSIFMVQHHPFTCFNVKYWFGNCENNWGFKKWQKKKIKKLIKKSGLSSKFSGNFAGHLHENHFIKVKFFSKNWIEEQTNIPGTFTKITIDNEGKISNRQIYHVGKNEEKTLKQRKTIISGLLFQILIICIFFSLIKSRIKIG